MSYGYCPICNGNVVSRERRMNGNDTCENGHTYRMMGTKKETRIGHLDPKMRLPVKNEPAVMPSKPEQWRPEIGQYYWTIEEIGIIRDARWEDDCIDHFRIALGIVFRTREEAQQKRKEMGL